MARIKDKVGDYASILEGTDFSDIIRGFGGADDPRRRQPRHAGLQREYRICGRGRRERDGHGHACERVVWGRHWHVRDGQRNGNGWI